MYAALETDLRLRTKPFAHLISLLTFLCHLGWHLTIITIIITIIIIILCRISYKILLHLEEHVLLRKDELNKHITLSAKSSLILP